MQFCKIPHGLIARRQETTHPQVLLFVRIVYQMESDNSPTNSKRSNLTESSIIMGYLCDDFEGEELAAKFIPCIIALKLCTAVTDI